MLNIYIYIYTLGWLSGIVTQLLELLRSRVALGSSAHNALVTGYYNWSSAKKLYHLPKSPRRLYNCACLFFFQLEKEYNSNDLYPSYGSAILDAEPQKKKHLKDWVETQRTMRRARLAEIYQFLPGVKTCTLYP
jgi:hypothetical protein